MTESNEESAPLLRENERLRSRIAALEAEVNRLTMPIDRSGDEGDQAEQFRDFFENAPIGKSMTAPDGRLLRVNRALADMLGYTKDELQSLSFQDISHPDDVAASQECVRSLLAGECDRYTAEKRYIAKDGHIVWTRFATARYCNRDGNVHHFLTHILDISDQKRAEGQLHEQRTLLQNLIESAGDAIFSLNHDYCYTSFNASHATAMKALYGVEIELGHCLFAYQGATLDHVQAKCNIDRALAGEHFTDEGFSGSDIATRAYFEVSHHPIRDDSGAIVGASVFARDTSARRQAEERLCQLNTQLDQRVVERTAQLEASNRELDAFSYSVSHDLRAPLRAIDGFSRILSEDYVDVLDDEGQRLCSIIRSNTGRMARLIDDLLGFARLGRAEINLSLNEMQAMAEEAFRELTDPGSRKRIDFAVGELPPALVDAALMRQVWTNLLSNAIKFSSKCERVNIIVRAEEAEGSHVYVVEDRGAGFDMQYRDKLFGVFQRLHSTKEFEGTGVGLALVQRIVHRHGGHVWAESVMGQGAKFYFSIPRHGDSQ